MLRPAHIAIVLVGLIVAAGAAAQQAAPDAAEPADQAATPPAPPPTQGVAPAAGANVAVIRVEGMIYGFTLESLQRRVDRALHNGASVIVLELDTPGGVLTSALDISKYVKTIPVHTVAWINNEAYSAGILIASACDELVMSPAAATGDAAPVVPGFGLGATERAKALSPLLEEFRDNARANGYDYTLFHAMCVLGVEVYRVRNPQTGETRLVNQVDYAVMVEGREPDSVAPAAPAADPAAAADPATVGAVRLEEATSADAGRWELVSRIHDGTTLLTLNQTRAEEVGLSAATIASRAELAQFLNAANVYTVDQTWSEDLAGYVYFLTHPLAKAILVMVLLIGAYIELQSPGFGFGGALALLALVALIGAPLVVGLAEWWHLGAFVLGLVLLGVELFVLPGFGVFGIAGLLLAFIGLVFAGVPTNGGVTPAPEMWNRVAMSAILMAIASVVCIGGMLWFTQRFSERLPLFNRLVLTTTQPAGAAATPTPAHISGDDAFAGGRVAVGDTGRVVTGLRPAGRVEINGQLIDAVTPGNWIDRGRDVKIIEVRGNRIVVDAV